MIRIATLADVPALAAILVDSIEGGASVNFMRGFTLAEAEEKYRLWLRDRVVFIAGEGDGTAQLILDVPPNQPHRAELAKMLVHRRARRRGIARALYFAACDEARRRGRSLLTFDTMTGGDAERVYLACGAIKAGEIPGFAYWPDGSGPGATSIFYARL